MSIEFTIEEIQELKKRAAVRVVNNLVSAIMKDINITEINAKVKNDIVSVLPMRR